MFIPQCHFFIVITILLLSNCSYSSANTYCCSVPSSYSFVFSFSHFLVSPLYDCISSGSFPFFFQCRSSSIARQALVLSLSCIPQAWRSLQADCYMLHAYKPRRCPKGASTHVLTSQWRRKHMKAKAHKYAIVDRATHE